jgi:hypothetical protein
MDANTFELKSTHARISYSSQGNAGHPVLSHKDATLNQTFQEADIRTLSSDVGELVTVTSGRRPGDENADPGIADGHSRPSENSCRHQDESNSNHFPEGSWFKHPRTQPDLSGGLSARNRAVSVH